MFKKIKQIILKQEKRKATRKIFFFSVLSAIIASFSTLFLSKKKNRIKIMEETKEAIQRVRDSTTKVASYTQDKVSKLGNQVHEQGEKLSHQAKDFFEKIGNQKHKNLESNKDVIQSTDKLEDASKNKADSKK